MNETRGAKPATPKLRFPEFVEAGEWRTIELRSALIFQVGFPFSSKEFNEEGRGLRLIRNRDLRSDAKVIYYSGPYSADFVVSDGDVLVGMDGDFAPCVWNRGSALLNQRVGRILPKAGNHKEFLLYFLTAHLKAIEDSTARTTVKHLSHSDVEKACEPLPGHHEQQKIADCLTSLDEVIAAQGRKVEALKAHKRGLMQQLFPREGETRPRLRFPEFRGAPEWRDTRLSKLGKLVSGLTYSPVDVRDKGLLVLRSSNVQDGEISLEDNVYVTPDIRGANLSKTNDILICVRNGSKALIGKSALIPDGMPVCTHGAFMTVFRAEVPKFAFQLMQSASFRKQVAADLGATINSINGSQLLRYRFAVPRRDEQERIADFLTSIDSRITAEAGRLAVLKSHKKGLMQQLLPAPEATGA